MVNKRKKKGGKMGTSPYDPTFGGTYKPRPKSKDVIVDFNPSSRTPITVDSDDLDVINETIREMGKEFARHQDKEVMAMLIALIAKKLREDPTFGEKLRDLLGLHKLRIKPVRRKISGKLKRKGQVLGEAVVEFEYELGC